MIARVEASSQALKEAHQDAEGATKFVEAIDALKVVVNELVKERIQTLQDLHKRQRLLIELESSDEFLRNPNDFLAVSPSSAAAIATKAATYGVEGDKNYFVACFRALSPCDNRVATFLRPFLNSEAEFLAQSLRTKRPTCFDDIVGIMPRLVLGAAALPSEEAQELLSRIFNTPGCPQWLISWYQYCRSRGLDRLPPADARADIVDTWAIAELAREIVAYGRYKGASLPLPPCLHLSGPPIRRGLMDEHLALLRLESFDGTINQDLKEVLNAERSGMAETPIVDLMGRADDSAPAVASASGAQAELTLTEEIARKILTEAGGIFVGRKELMRLGVVQKGASIPPIPPEFSRGFFEAQHPLREGQIAGHVILGYDPKTDRWYCFEKSVIEVSFSRAKRMVRKDKMLSYKDGRQITRNGLQYSSPKDYRPIQRILNSLIKLHMRDGGIEEHLPFYDTCAITFDTIGSYFNCCVTISVIDGKGSHAGPYALLMPELCDTVGLLPSWEHQASVARPGLLAGVKMGWRLLRVTFGSILRYSYI